MAGKLPNAMDKGRCSRCYLQYYGVPRHKPEDSPRGNICYRYDNYCCRVAWNCKAPPDGYRKEDIKPEIAAKIVKLRTV